MSDHGETVSDATIDFLSDECILACHRPPSRNRHSFICFRVVYSPLRLLAWSIDIHIRNFDL